MARGRYIQGDFEANSKPFDYIDRSILSTKRKFESLDIGSNIKYDPDGKMTLRDGYTQIFTSQPNWFEGTTPFSKRMISDDLVNTSWNNLYTSVRRKCVLEVSNGSDRYVFAGLVKYNISGTLLQLDIYRSPKLSADGEVTWIPTEFYTVTADGDNQMKYLGDELDYDQKWIEFSMAASSDGSKIYIVVVRRNDDDATTNLNYSILQVFQLSDIFGANFNNVNHPTVENLKLLSTGETSIIIDGADSITHDVDIVVDAANRIHVGYGYWHNSEGLFELKFLQAGATHYDDDIITFATAGTNYYGLTLARRGIGIAETIIALYISDGVAQVIKMAQWRSNLNPSIGLTIISSGFQLAAGNSRFASSIAFAADSAGTLHLLYRNGATTLAYSSISSGEIVTTTALPASYALNTGYVSAPNDLLAEELTNWDLVVRANSAFIYFVDDATGYQIRCGSNISGAFDASPKLVHKSQQSGTPHVSYLNCDRQYRSTAPRRLTFLDINVPAAGAITIDFMYLRQELDAILGELSLEMLHDMNLTETTGVSTQTKIVHCSNNRFYKRNDTDWHYKELENGMDCDNAEEAWWKSMDDAITAGGFALTQAPDPVTHVRFLERRKVLSAGYGVGEKLCGASYCLIDRRHFDNSGTYDYKGHWLDVDKVLKAPDASILAPTVAGTFGRPISALIRRVNSEGVWVYDSLWNNVAGSTLDDHAHYRFPQGEGLKISNQQAETDTDEEFASDDKCIYRFIDADNKGWKIKAFYVGLVFVYDGYEESQMWIVPNDYIDNVWNYLQNNQDHDVVSNPGVIAIGYTLNRNAVGADRFAQAITVNLRLSDLATRVVGGLNPRITSVRIYLGEITDPAQKPEDVPFYPAKDVYISQANKFKDEWWNGDKEWTKTGNYWTHQIAAADVPVVIDLNDIYSMVNLGTYESINGHGDTILDATNGLQRSPFLESWTDSMDFNGTLCVGGVRVDGVNRPNRIMKCALKVTSSATTALTPDIFSSLDAIDLPFNFKRFAKLDENTAVIIGDTGIGVLDVPNWQFRVVGSAIGIDSPDSIADMSVGKEGVAFLVKDSYRLFQGFTDPEDISLPIRRTSEIGSITGIEDIATLNDCWAFYLSDAQQLILIFRATGYPVFILDTRKGGGWLQATFTDNFKCGCLGIDGKMYWTSGYKVFKYPYGTTDNGVKFSPDTRFSDLQVPNDMELDVERFFVRHNNTNAENMTVTVIRDRNTVLNVAHTVTGTGSITNTRREMAFTGGRRCKQTVSLRIQATQPTTFNIEDVSIVGKLLERIS